MSRRFRKVGWVVAILLNPVLIRADDAEASTPFLAGFEYVEPTREL